jgi:hypothetical protein
MGTSSTFSEVKLPGREPDHSHPPSAKVALYLRLPIYIFMAQWVINNRDNFTFTLHHTVINPT